MGDLQEAFDQAVPEGPLVVSVLLQVGRRLFERGCHSHDPGDILGACPFALLLGSALDQVGQGNPLPRIEEADALGAVEFMGRCGQHIDVHGLYVDGQMADGLDRIRVEEDSALLTDRPDLRDRLDGPDLIVGGHDRDQAGVLPDRRLQLPDIDDAVLMDRKKSHLESFLLQPLQGVEDGMVLKRGGNDVLFALSLSDLRSRPQGLVVGFAPAGGKEDLLRVRVDHSRDLLACLLQGLLGLLPDRIEAGRVPVYIFHIEKHGLNGCSAHSCCCGIVCVDLHLSCLRIFSDHVNVQKNNLCIICVLRSGSSSGFHRTG